MTNETLIAALAVFTTLGGLIAWAIREVRALRGEIVQLKLQLGIGPSRTVYDTIRDEIREHAVTCPTREPTDVRGIERSKTWG